MTLRGRLTTAFLAVVLGPVLLGAFFVGGAVTVVGADRAMERLDRAGSAVATSVGALCRQLNVAAGAVAIVTDERARQAAANRVVAGGFGDAVQVKAADGQLVLITPDAPPQPWIDCMGPRGLGADGMDGTGYGAIAARVELRDGTGVSLGSVTVASTLDREFVARLARAAGSSVTLLGSSPRGGPVAVHSTERPGVREAVVRAAAALTGGRTARTGDGARWVRRVGPSAQQPLPLALAVSRRPPQGLYALLVAAVVLTAVFVVAMAWWLARSTTRPLAELARAADRVAGGDLAARVPVRAQDEVGRLAATFNRMTRETQAYVQALTASRDQLRGHLAILGDTLSSTHDLGRILQVILQTALAATGARAGVVLLLDPATSTLVGQCAEGLDERWPAAGPGPGTANASGPGRGGGHVALSAAGLRAGSGAFASLRAGSGSGTDPRTGSGAGTQPCTGSGAGADPRAGHDAPDRAVPRQPLSLAEEPTEDLTERDPATLRVPVGSGLLGSVAATGVPLRGHIDRDGPPLSPSEPRCRTYVAVPFSMPAPRCGDVPGPGDPPRPSALGVLALYDRLGSDEFDDSDVTTLRTFAGQAAVAVDNVRVHREAQRLSLTDPLTGLWNYRYLQESVRREVDRANRFHRLLAVLAMDLDRFKEVNDTYGHGAGDAVLAEFARRIRIGLREVDLAFRQGGEEFVVLLPETDRVGAAAVAARLGALVRDEPVSIPAPGCTGQPTAHIAITVSIGIAVYPDHGATVEKVLDAADDALYAAKAGGRDTYQVAICGGPSTAGAAAARGAPDPAPAGGRPAPAGGRPAPGGGAAGTAASGAGSAVAEVSGTAASGAGSAVAEVSGTAASGAGSAVAEVSGTAASGMGPAGTGVSGTGSTRTGAAGTGSAAGVVDGHSGASGTVVANTPAGDSAGGDPRASGASSGTQPPRQTRGR